MHLGGGSVYVCLLCEWVGEGEVELSFAIR